MSDFGELVLKSKWADKGLFIHTGKTRKVTYSKVNDLPIQIITIILIVADVSGMIIG